MKLYKIKTKKYILHCPECLGLANFKINSNDFVFKGECQNGHIFDNITLKEFGTCINKIWCSKNYEDKNNIINNCYNCNKTITCNCKNKEYCSIHSLKYDYHLNNNKIYLCEECQKLIPYINNKKEIKNTIKEYNNKIEELLKNIEKKIDEIIKIYNILKEFLNVFIIINNNLLKKFNYTICDNYFNYENFDYFFNYQKRDEFLDKNKYFNYILIGSNLNIPNDYKNNISILNNKNKINKNVEKIEYFNVIDSYLNLKYFKDNKFYFFERNIIRLFEYIDSTFKVLYTYKYNNDPKSYDTNIEYCIKSDYNHFICILGNKKDIIILEYNDLENKIFTKYKMNIGVLHSYKSLIENKNGNIVMREKKCISVWSLNEKQIEMIKKYKKIFYNLNNVNDFMFLTVNYYWDNTANVTFYETEKYNNIKSLRLLIDVNLINTINNELLVIINKNITFIYVIGIKFLEIVQIIQYEKSDSCFLFFNELSFFKIFIGNNEVILEKYDIGEACFKYFEIIKYKRNYNIEILSNNFVIFNNSNKFELFKLLHN